ncbi:hypothetical protein J2Z66_007239 [Paenibacillus eucommiae]|uniref:Uncharacterized protein n=1 Tax=Paenibacillus eucommiae TaxID=1355755 RepID=A0ABS4J701_9BACL|nr:hypothetical protein [Paenibacillus eucommiae]
MLGNGCGLQPLLKICSLEWKRMRRLEQIFKGGRYRSSTHSHSLLQLQSHEHHAQMDRQQGIFSWLEEISRVQRRWGRRARAAAKDLLL